MKASIQNKFTGGDNLRPNTLAYYLHCTVMKNELYNGLGAYKIDTSNSTGISFGAIRYDIAHSVHGRILFTQALNKQGKNITTTKDITKTKQDFSIPFNSQKIIIDKNYNKYIKFIDILQIILPDINKNTVHITSNFGQRLLNGKLNTHKGIDFNYIGGQKGINLQHPAVKSPIGGKITFVGGNYGTVKIQDSKGNSHEILHLNSQIVKIGQIVKAGQTIGKMGGTGPNGKHQFAEHVHYQIKDNTGTIINPLEWWNKNLLQINFDNNKQSALSFKESSWNVVPINLDNKDPRYVKIQENLKVLMPNFLTLSVIEQTNIVKEYIINQNKQKLDAVLAQSQLSSNHQTVQVGNFTRSYRF